MYDASSLAGPVNRDQRSQMKFIKLLRLRVPAQGQPVEGD